MGPGVSSDASSNFWDIVLGHHLEGNTSTMGNSTIDVMHKNCFTDYDTTACVRSTILCFLYAFTALACAARLYALHHSGRRRPSDPLLMAFFYLAGAQSLMG